MASRWFALAFASIVILPIADAQQSPAPTLAERVAALERQVARLDTRTGIESAIRPGVTEQGGNLVARIDALERSMVALNTYLDRVQRQADDALRAATQAQRDAQAAQQAARDVAMRVH
jgi:ABC-type branched-subunit amino acid transport system substrate-binding protein